MYVCIFVCLFVCLIDVFDVDVFDVNIVYVVQVCLRALRLRVCIYLYSLWKIRIRYAHIAHIY